MTQSQPKNAGAIHRCAKCRVGSDVAPLYIVGPRSQLCRECATPAEIHNAALPFRCIAEGCTHARSSSTRFWRFCSAACEATSARLWKERQADPPSSPAEVESLDRFASLIESRADTWARRARKWHRALDRERAWLWRGVALPAVVSACCALAVVLKADHGGVVPAIGVVITALISVRAHAARTQLDQGKIDQAWVSADRMAEHYRGLLVLSQAATREVEISGAFMESQRLEAAARFGVPPTLAETLQAVTR